MWMLVRLHRLTSTNQISRKCPSPCPPSFPRMTWWSQHYIRVWYFMTLVFIEYLQPIDSRHRNLVGQDIYRVENTYCLHSRHLSPFLDFDCVFPVSDRRSNNGVNVWQIMFSCSLLLTNTCSFSVSMMLDFLTDVSVRPDASSFLFVLPDTSTVSDCSHRMSKYSLTHPPPPLHHFQSKWWIGYL